MVLRRSGDVGVSGKRAPAWEPFSEPARHVMIRAQAVAQMFGSTSIDTEHLAFALAEGDDELAHLLADAFDREVMRERLGVARGTPDAEMEFSSDMKHAIEGAFTNARRLHQHFIGRAVVALGVLDLAGAPPLAPGVDRDVLRERITTLAQSESP